MTPGSGPRLGLLLLLALLLQTVVVTITVLHFTTALNSMKASFSSSSVSCLMDVDLQSVSAVRGDPCWQVTQQLHLLIQKSLSQRYQKQISTVVRDEVSRVLPSLVMVDRASPRPKVAAHVTGSFTPRLEGDAPPPPGRRVQGQKISWWEGRRGLAFLQDVQLVDGELVVPLPGLYYVYAQTYFRHNHQQEQEEEQEEQEEQQEQREEREERGRPLLQYVYKKAGDRLFVSVTNASAVDMDEKSSFFGAFLIS